MNKKTRALTEEQYRKIIETIKNGFECADGHIVAPNIRVATALTLEANLGIRISDILKLRLSSIIKDGERYRLDIVEQKTNKKRRVYSSGRSVCLYSELCFEKQYQSCCQVV